VEAMPVSYRDVPAMSELLTTQKKIRSILKDWLNYCRTSLKIMEPDMYILPELNNQPPNQQRQQQQQQQHQQFSRFNKNHSNYEKIVLHRRKSKSADISTRDSRRRVLVFNNNDPNNTKNKSTTSNNKVADQIVTVKLDLDQQRRSKSALIGNFLIFFQ
jgi:hypothetical protein